jgi:hypothetical protein
MATKQQDKVFTKCVLNGGEWHVEWQVHEGGKPVATHVLGIDAESLAADPNHYRTEYPDAFAAIEKVQAG